jgi:carbon-monoxide dehydrogenase large subunit
LARGAQGRQGFITGKGRYVDDIGWSDDLRAFRCSPHAHAKVKSIDISAAKDMPGVADAHRQTDR